MADPGMSGPDVRAVLAHPEVLNEVQAVARAAVRTAGKLVVELNMKDGVWSLGNLILTFPRRR